MSDTTESSHTLALIRQRVVLMPFKGGRRIDAPIPRCDSYAHSLDGDIPIERPSVAAEGRSARGYPRASGEDDYTYWQWVTAEEYAELEEAEDNGASAEVKAEIQARVDSHIKRFRAAAARSSIAVKGKAQRR